MSHSLCPAISPGRKWWQTVLKIKFHYPPGSSVYWFVSAMNFVEINKVSCKSEGSACSHERSSFFRLGSKGGRGIFWYFPLFPMCSHRGHQVLKLFLNIIQTAAQFYPIQFAQNSTLMYINWKAGPRRAHLSMKQGSLFCFVWSSWDLPNHCGGGMGV
jgi:hypothetical protein